MKEEWMKLLACLHQVVGDVKVVDLVGVPLTEGLEDIIGRAQEDVVEGLDGEDLAHPLVEDAGMEDDGRFMTIVVTESN